MVTVRGWLAVLLSTLAVGGAAAFGGGFDPGPGAAAGGGGVTVGDAVSGGTSPCILYTDSTGDVQCDTAQFQLATDGNTYNTVVLEGPDATSAGNLIISRSDDTQSSQMMFWTNFPAAASGADPVYGLQHRADETFWIKRNDGASDFAMLTFDTASKATFSGALSGTSSQFTGQMLFSGVTTDVSTGTDEDLTLAPNGTGAVVVSAANLGVGELLYGSGASTCDSVGTAGNLCIQDANGTVVTTGGTAAQVALAVKVPDVSAAADPPGITTLYSASSSAWLGIGANGSATASTVLPLIQTRAMGTAAGTGGLLFVGGMESGGDTTSATWPVVGVDGRREAGTPTSASGSAITGKPLFGVHNNNTKVFAINVNGGLGLRHISPTALSGDVDNYAGCTTTPICRIDGGASSRNVTGIVPGYNSAYESSQSELFYVCAIGANDLVLKHDVTSTAANRFTFNAGTDRTVLAGSCFPLIYDRTTQRWRAANGT